MQYGGDFYFNSRPSARGDERRHCRRHRVRFQFTPLREGRLKFEAHYHVTSVISIHAPPRGATRCTTSTRPTSRFQFTPLREGRQVLVAETDEGRIDFNSRPSARGDDWTDDEVWEFLISIHAPPRGATTGKFPITYERYISIHAPPRGATARMICGAAPCIFQFTPLREGRRETG